MTDLRFDQLFAAPFASSQYDSVVNRVTERAFIAAGAANILRYTAATQTYSYTLENSVYTNLFPSQDFRISDSTVDGDFFVFQNQESTIERRNIYRLRLSRPGTVNSRIALSHAGFGSFEYDFLARGFTTSNDYRPFSYAIATDAAGLARTGVLEYSGVVDGRIIPKGSGTIDELVPVIGTFRLRVDFSGRILTGTVTLNTNKQVTANDPRPVQQALGTYNLSSPALSSLRSLSGSAGNGQFAGVLAGPNAEELSLTMSFEFPYTSASRTATATLVASGGARR